MHEQVKGPDWVLVNEKADWEARDSQGMMVFEDHMWIYGGWFTPQTSNPRDVWKSNDGINWTCTTEEALWVHGDFPATMPLNGKMWLMGGLLPSRAEATSSDSVHSLFLRLSTDGLDSKWTRLLLLPAGISGKPA